MSRLDLVFAHCADIGVDVVYVDLGQRRGEYLDELGLIRLNRRMTRAQMTATAAHELAHAVFGDRHSTPAIERRASEYGASLIISAREYAAAEDLVGRHPNALAAELGVTPPFIEAWRRWWHRQGSPAAQRARDAALRLQ